MYVCCVCMYVDRQMTERQIDISREIVYMTYKLTKIGN